MVVFSQCDSGGRESGKIDIPPRYTGITAMY